MDYSLEEIVALLKKRFILILISTLTGLLIFYIVNRALIAPTYTATAQLYVNTKDTEITANINDLNYAQKIVTTYVNFLKTKVFYDQVLEESGLGYTRGQLSSMTEIKTVGNTEIFQISVTSLYPQDSFVLVGAMQNIAQELIKGIKPDTEVSIVDPAVLPLSPSGPNVLVNTAIGGFLGLVLSVMTAFFMDITYAKVKNQEDMKNRYEIPVLGAIPDFYNEKMNRKNSRFFRFKEYFIRKRRNVLRKDKSMSKKKGHKQDDRNEQYKKEKRSVKIKDHDFIISEAYKALRTNLRFSLLNEGCKKIIINSPVPEDGKSTTSAHLAITIAQTGAKVLLVDCDLRKGKIHTFFNLKSRPGLSDALTSANRKVEAIKKTNYENLEIMSHGTIPPNPAELLASPQMEGLLNELEKSYDYIIIDSPPINIVSDSLSLVKLVDGILIVVRERVTTHSEIADALAKYRIASANLLGFVINQMKVDRSKKYYHKYYKYEK